MSGGVPAGELLPCPFCGSEAVLRGQDAPEYWVACPGIGCEANTESFSSKNAAIAVWNARTTPAGWVLVPVEPTEAMLTAAYDAAAEWGVHLHDSGLSVYRSMLAATPTPPIEGRDADVERVARAIADANGDDFDSALPNMSEGILTRGMRGGQYRDVNEPFQSDYLEMARAALQALGERP